MRSMETADVSTFPIPSRTSTSHGTHPAHNHQGAYAPLATPRLNVKRSIDDACQTHRGNVMEMRKGIGERLVTGARLHLRAVAAIT